MITSVGERKWDLQNIPPMGDVDVADFAYKLFQVAKAEKERLGKNNDFLSNYALYRGQQNRQMSARKGSPQSTTKGRFPVNLFFANVERTVSSITARNPTGEVVDMDGVSDGAENVLSQSLKKWWQDTDQQAKTRESARTMEIYGITAEKPHWDKYTDNPDIMITDPFTFFPAPGYYANLSEELPYICFCYLDFVSRMENEFNVEGIGKEDSYDILGAVREDFKPPTYGGQNKTMGNYAEAVTVTRTGQYQDDKVIERCMPIEVWVRDNREVTVKEETPVIGEDGQPTPDENGLPMVQIIERKVRACPDGIRKITIVKAKTPVKGTKFGYMVIGDCANPNVNPSLPIELASNTYPWGRLPIYHANSYKDQITIWGFSAAEQVGDLIIKINQIVSKLINYVINVMTPPLIVQQHCGITREMIESSIQKAGRLVLMPTTPNARIEFMQVPNLPSTFFQVLDLIVGFFDRIYQIEDADRGVGPTGVIAASAIVALQERNQVVMQTKTTAIDSLAEQRARWAIGLWQNFGIAEDTVNVAGEQKQYRGVNYAARKFSYVVEAGSTTPRTSLQMQEMAMGLFKEHAIGQQGLLEALNWPNWKEEMARTADNQLDQALQILIDAGLTPEVAMQMKQGLLQAQQEKEAAKRSGGGGDKTASQQPQPGVPKAQQGQTGGGSAAGVPARATGGPVTAGTPYVVGEQGKEIFVPTSDGFIVPNPASVTKTKTVQ